MAKKHSNEKVKSEKNGDLGQTPEQVSFFFMVFLYVNDIQKKNGK